MRKIVILIGIILLGLNIQAQTYFLVSDSDMLIYIKWMNDKKTYVVWHGLETYSYQPNDDECIELSPDGRYLAWSTEDAEIFKIFTSQRWNYFINKNGMKYGSHAV